jgi:preprotein translocase subunit SecE
VAERIRRTRDFLEDVRVEMQKVTWPDWPQLKNSTWVILVFVVAVSLLIFGIDNVVRVVLDLVASIFRG